MVSRSRRFGSKLRSLREHKGLGLRELARKAGISPAFLSKIEGGKEKPPAEKKLKALARALGCDADVLLALSGRLPSDVVRTIQKHPYEYVALIRNLRNFNAKQLEQVRSQIPVTLVPMSSEDMDNLMKLAQRGEPSHIQFVVEEDATTSTSEIMNETKEHREKEGDS